MKIANKLAATALLAASLMLTGCGQGQIGYVNVDKVMEEAPRVKTLMSEAETKMKDAEQKFEQDRAANPNMSQEDAAKLQMDFQRKISGINQAAASQIRSRMDVVIAEISQAKDIDVVIANSPDQKVLFQGGIDVTEDVIKKMQ
ncbi:MAG: OmpH family outer membrane protein [Selenomonadaceae bacterium]|nr:OmpH family outer membrane protein [Selenomonadaceae bacterium]